jgi:hypothetical protein
MDKILIGSTVVDKLTGFTGVVIGKAQHAYSGEDALVQPTTCKDGEFPTAVWISVARLASAAQTVPPSA